MRVWMIGSRVVGWGRVAHSSRYRSQLTLFLLTAELGHSKRSDSEELCSSLHTCHRKCRKEPPVGRGQHLSWTLWCEVCPVPHGWGRGRKLPRAGTQPASPIEGNHTASRLA